jgi:Bacterial dnaA protein helix-turn-helix
LRVELKKLDAVSRRAAVPVDAIFGRQRIQEIAAARHDAMWRVRQATDWSLPRVGNSSPAAIKPPSFFPCDAWRRARHENLSSAAT